MTFMAGDRLQPVKGFVPFVCFVVVSGCAEQPQAITRLPWAISRLLTRPPTNCNSITTIWGSCDNGGSLAQNP